MKDLKLLIQTIEQTFERILQENMQGIPILNPEIRVQAVGFQIWQNRVLGIIITPWLMNLVLFPTDNEDWSQMELGHKQPHEFPSRSYKFMVNDIEGIGPCQTYSLCSPMREFASHEQALQVAEDFLEDLLIETELTEEERVDEDLLGRIMRGEETPEINLDQFDEASTMLDDPAIATNRTDIQSVIENKISRRNLLRGDLTS